MKSNRLGNLARDLLESIFITLPTQLEQAEKGHNPFDDFCIDKTFNYIVHNSKPADANEIRLSSICTAYNPDWYTSKYVYDDIKSNIERLIEDAITIRNRFPK